MRQANTIDSIKQLHQYYRDGLSQPVNFPSHGQLPAELLQWVVDYRNTDSVQLAEYLSTLPPSGLPENEDLALRLMLHTILQANLATEYNNRYPDFTLPEPVAANVKRGIARVLELSPQHDYIAIAVQLLFRIKEVEEVLALAADYPAIFAKYPMLQLVAGFTHTMLGNYQQALDYLQPLVDNPATRNLPHAAMSAMTCQHMLGQVPRWPLDFSSLHGGTGELARLLKVLPAIEMIEPLAPAERPVVFVACDTGYFFEHALLLACSLHDTNAGRLDLHLHLYSPEHRVFAEIERLRARLPGLAIGVSVEYGSPAVRDRGTYYATARFVRAWEVLERYGRELCMVDADALFNAGWDTFRAMVDQDIELALACPANAPFWEQVVAGFVWCRPTPLAREFLAHVAQFILHNIEQGWLVWFADQVALSAADHLLTAADPAVAHLDADRVIDVRFGQDSLLWAVTTRKTGNPPYDAARARLQRQYG